MDQQDIAIAVGGIIISIGILAVGFNKITPDTYRDDSFGRSTMGWNDMYPESRRTLPEFEEPDRFEERKTDSSTRVIVGGRVLCKRCTRRK